MATKKPKVKKEDKPQKKVKVERKNEIKDENSQKQIKLLKVIIEDLINKQSVEIIDLLAGKKDVNEFTIAKNLNLTINQTRNILYKLSDFGLVSFNRKKDKRKGWYIYFWTLNSFQALDLLEENLKKKLEVLENNIKNRRDGRHYVCNTCSIEINEETALLNDFVCSECDEVYELSDDTEVIQDLEKKIFKLKKELEHVVSEKGKEGDKIDKEKIRKIKRVEKKKSNERAKSRKNNAIKKKKEKAAIERAENKKKDKKKKVSNVKKKKPAKKKSAKKKRK
ncbi:MAG: hypothetical protein ABIH37_00550 [archaeon]